MLTLGALLAISCRRTARVGFTEVDLKNLPTRDYLVVDYPLSVTVHVGAQTAVAFDEKMPKRIREDIEWLGFHWGNIYYASDYFERLYQFAEELIRAGHAYVDEQTAEEIAAQKGTPTTPGVASPYRDRPIEESLDLFRRMNAGEFPEGAMILRAKIDMASSNMHFRDPIIYRIIKVPHHRTGTKWGVYPMYDFAHGQSDFFEGVTHSICTLEFEVHRPLYDYFVDLLKKVEPNHPEGYRPRQIEFNRLNLTYTMMSKRKLLQLVQEGHVAGWDDPRMPTICGLRRRGYTPESIRSFIDKIGYTKYDGIIDMALLGHAVRAFEHHVLQSVAQAGFALMLIHAADLVPQPHGRHRRARILLNQYLHPVGQRREQRFRLHRRQTRQQQQSGIAQHFSDSYPM